MNILGHDSSTTAALISEHATVLGRLCMALLGSQSEAEQALQDTLLTALAEPTGARGDAAPRAWLCGIARRKCAQRLAARTRERELRQSSGAAPSAPSTSADRPIMPQRARLLLGEIRPSEREALVLRFAAELSFGELAEAAGIDEATARRRVSRGLARMRALLGEEKP
ncbi:MAG TPA: RNA polymerase sigma factor [Polyangiaceae bacterium]